jgi:hypothetical protein
VIVVSRLGLHAFVRVLKSKPTGYSKIIRSLEKDLRLASLDVSPPKLEPLVAQALLNFEGVCH